MKEKYVILRALTSTALESALLGTKSVLPPDDGEGLQWAIELDELDEGKALEVRKKADVEAVAPVMPLRLIEPYDLPVASAATADAGWGVRAVGAGTSEFSGNGIVVAVLDTGIDPAHAAFAGVALVQRNFTDAPNGNDTHGHGTHCAGTIFGRDIGGTRIGIARGVKRALIGKVLGVNGGASDQVVSAIQWAVQEGAHVISMSLGMDFPGLQKKLVEEIGLPPELATSKALEGYRQNVRLFERLASTVKALGSFVQGSIIIAAAGNESRTDQNPNFKIAVSPPAVADGIISVAALGRSPEGLVVASFSNIGALVAGPGVEITSARLGGGLSVKSGTSMATPHVAGVAALWAEKLKKRGPLKPDLFASAVMGSGTFTGLNPGVEPLDVGTGLVQAPQH